MTVTDGQAAAFAADSLQAKYFRTELSAYQRALTDSIANRKRLLEGHSTPSQISRLRALVRSDEAELRNLDRMIDRLDKRF